MTVQQVKVHLLYLKKQIILEEESMFFLMMASGTLELLLVEI